MDAKRVEAAFQNKISAEVRVESEGLDRYRVFTPFLFEDGDSLSIVLKREGKLWFLSDEGHTYQHLTYDLDEKDLQRGSRHRIISGALSVFQVQDRDGELMLAVRDDEYGDALYSFAQALLKVSDVTYLTRERVRSTFLEDFRVFMREVVSEERLKFIWTDPLHDPKGNYVVDCRINGIARPLMVFALPNDDRTRDATITLLQFEKWQIPFRSLAIFEDVEDINGKVQARFIDVCEKQYSSIASARERGKRHIESILSGE